MQGLIAKTQLISTSDILPPTQKNCRISYPMFQMKQILIGWSLVVEVVGLFKAIIQVELMKRPSIT